MRVTSRRNDERLTRRLRFRRKDCPDLHMRPPPAASRLDVSLVELGGNLIVACGTRPHDLLNDRARAQSLPEHRALRSESS
jgi:hypothetical protein